jgi:SAM-dependent methyltransferase
MTAAAEPAAHSAPAVPPALAIMQMIAGRWVSGAVTTAARLQLPDRLAGKPQTSEELAEAAGAHAPSLYRLLRALASLGLMTEGPDSRFALTPLGDYLRSDVPGSMFGLVQFFASEEHGATWNALPYAVTSGEPAFEHLYGCTLWEYLDNEPALNVIFSDAMTSFMSTLQGEIVERLDLTGARTVADVGGASGALLAEILERHPGVRGILYERPAVIADVRRDAPDVLRERCDFVAGDFLERVPAADVLVLSHVLHDWSDADAARILTNCRAALPPHGRLIVVDHVLEPGDAPDFAKLLDLEMLAINAGRERTRAEFETLFARAGLRLAGVTPLHGTALVEGVPAA